MKDINDFLNFFFNGSFLNCTIGILYIKTILLNIYYVCKAKNTQCKSKIYLQEMMTYMKNLPFWCQRQ